MSTSDQLGIGVIGLGTFGEEHVRTLLGFPHIELSICDVDAARLEAIGNRYGIDRRYASSEELIADAGIVAAIIATPEDQHVAPALGALAAGKHILVEKPIATTLADADKLITAAQQGRVILAIGHVLRYDPRYIQVAERIHRGDLGDIASIYARRNPARHIFETYQRVFPPLVTSIHDVDLALWYAQEPVVEVYCTAHTTVGRSRPDVYWMLLRFARGSLAAIETVWLVPPGSPAALDAAMEVIGTHGTAHIESAFQAVSIWGEDHAEHPDSFHWPHVRGANVGALRDELLDFVTCIRNGSPLKGITPDEARAALQVVLAAEESLRTERPIRL